MNSAMMRMISRLLIVSMLAMPFQTVQAGMIATEQATLALVQVERDRLARMVDRPEVVSQLQTLGLDARTAHERLAALTDEEVRSLAGKLNALPAGADSGWGWVILIALGIWAYYSWRR